VRQTFNVPQYDFALVEIDPLLAFQFTVDRDRSHHHCKALRTPPSVDEMLPVCLPGAHSQEDVQFSGASNMAHLNSMVVKSRNTGLRIDGSGLFQGQNIVGAQIGFSLPLAHVVEWEGRYYLHNGYHRAIGCRAAGATHMPCVLRSVNTAQEAAINPPQTFDEALLKSANPPTVGHFTQGRACDVQLRSMLKIITISWAEHLVPNE
jgi:hypothetical protein